MAGFIGDSFTVFFFSSKTVLYNPFKQAIKNKNFYAVWLLMWFYFSFFRYKRNKSHKELMQGLVVMMLVKMVLVNDIYRNLYALQGDLA